MAQPMQSTTALASIWGAVLAISVLAPDLVSGSQQEHLPIAAFGTWLWGMVATRSVMSTLPRLNRDPGSDQVAGQLAGFVSAVWLVAAAVAVFAPEMVTGSDPTRLPIAALVAPIAATVLTTGACEMAASFPSTRRPTAS